MVSVVGVDHAPTTGFATEAYTLSPGIPISVQELGSVSDRGLETLSTVSDHPVLTIVVANWHMFLAAHSMQDSQQSVSISADTYVMSPFQRCAIHLC